MRLDTTRIVLCLHFLLALVIIPTVHSWDKLDFEIFELWDAVKSKDSHTNWYELMGVPKRATSNDIAKAYRKLSVKYHPDKVKGTERQKRRASAKFARMGLVAKILKEPHSRERYDFFLRNGVPVWRGTGYLYKRWRPGFLLVAAQLVLFGSVMQYLFQWLSYKRAQQRIRQFEEDAATEKPKPCCSASIPTQKTAANYRKIRGGRGPAPKHPAQEEPSSDDNSDSDTEESVAVTALDPYSVQPPKLSSLFIIAIPCGIARLALSPFQSARKQGANKSDIHNKPGKKANYGSDGETPPAESKCGKASPNTDHCSDKEFDAMLVKKSLVEKAMRAEKEESTGLEQVSAAAGNKGNTARRRRKH